MSLAAQFEQALSYPFCPPRRCSGATFTRLSRSNFVRYVGRMAQYELIILGSPPPGACATIAANLGPVLVDFEMTMPDDLAIRTPQDLADRNPAASTAALYFGGDPIIDKDVIDNLEAARVPIVPIVPAGEKLATTVPAEICNTNAYFLDPADPGMVGVTAVALECLGLLRRQRRVFISYRRDDSRSAAVQLHDELSGRGYDVFLDTHDIIPGDIFQEMLWHRLADCDVVIMLDTKDYFASKWTKQELGRSLAQGIHILRIIWPRQAGEKGASRHLSLSDSMLLTLDDFDSNGILDAARISEVVRRTETLRSRSVASRHREIAGKLRIEAERIGGTFEGIGAHRSMTLSLPNGLVVEAYPAVGVPTAELLNDIHEKARQANHGRLPCLVYDHHGIRPGWRKHLEWLNEQVKEVRALQVFDAAWELAEWDS